jgi:hypothetical protein
MPPSFGISAIVERQTFRKLPQRNIMDTNTNTEAYSKKIAKKIAKDKLRRNVVAAISYVWVGVVVVAAVICLMPSCPSCQDTDHTA